MNEGGKSDRPIVLKTPSNKGGGNRLDERHPATLPAERVEGRGLAKDNPLQQNQSIGLRAAPDWQSALERIRQTPLKQCLRVMIRGRSPVR